MRKFGISLWFYFRENFTKKNLLILSAFTFGIVLIAFIVNIFSDRYNDVAIVNHSPAFALTEAHFEELSNWHIHFPDTEEAARAMLDNGEVSEIYVIEGDARPSIRIIAQNEAFSNQLQMFVSQTLTMTHLENVITRYELPPGAVAELITPIEIEFETLLDIEDAMAAQIIGLIVSWSLYMLVLVSGQGVSSSIVAEKSSKVMEVMMAKVHPTTTMLAKVVSFFGDLILLGLAVTLGVVISQTLGLFDITEVLSFIGEVVSVELAIFAVIIVLLGYFMFVFVFAALGAIAVSVESLNTVMVPVTFALIVPLLASSMMDLGSRLMNILVYVPIFSPFVIMQRYIRGYSGIIEMSIIIVIMAASMVLMLFVAARLNKNGIMHTKESFSFKDFKKLMQR